MALNEEGFVFDPETGSSFVVNPTGLFILKKLREGMDEEGVIRALTEEFEVDGDTARRDFYDFIEQLRILGLIDSSPTGGQGA